jgi:hypothetical protein
MIALHTLPIPEAQYLAHGTFLRTTFSVVTETPEEAAAQAAVDVEFERRLELVLSGPALTFDCDWPWLRSAVADVAWGSGMLQLFTLSVEAFPFHGAKVFVGTTQAVARLVSSLGTPDDRRALIDLMKQTLPLPFVDAFPAVFDVILQAEASGSGMLSRLT